MSRYAEAHKKPQGVGDARPTALQIIKDEDLLGKLIDKVFLITGCSSGIGIETARALHATGATVFVTGRNTEKTQAVVDEIITSDPENKAPIHFIKIELDSLDSVRAGAKEFLEKSDKLNALICNAGVMATPYGRTKDGFETQFGTDHLSHFLLFQLLKPTLLKSSTPSFNSRVVSVSSTGHRRSEIRFDDFNFAKESDYDPWLGYGQAKTANVYFANEIDRRYGTQGLHATSVHPGGIFTGLQIHVGEDMKKRWMNPEAQKGFKNVEQGAATQVWAAISKDWEGKGGKYLYNCAIGLPVAEDSLEGYAEWAYDEEKEKKLWNESLRMVGLEDDV